MDRLTQRLQMALRALATLQELTRIASPTLVERDAAIQQFAYSTEACWKAAQSVLSVLQRWMAALEQPTDRQTDRPTDRQIDRPAL